DQLNGFAAEVTRVAREVGSDGKLGGQAQVVGVGGVWKDLTDNVNSMAANLTGQVRNIAEVTTAVAKGDLSRKITVDVKGEILALKGTVNTMVDQLNGFASEVTRVAREVGTEGKLGGQAQVPGVGGTWKDLTDNVNVMAANLTDQVRGIAEVATAIARGDLSRKITVDVKGELLELKNTINTMVDQLNSFAAEVTRVAREVGTEGKLGGQAKVPGVAGTWKDLTDNVNSMAGNLTAQVRNIAEVTTAVARGDLSRKITVDVQGEILELKNTINTMVDQLNSFASEVTRVAREVGTEGKLGGQATVPGVAGTWKGLTDNVNVMAANLTNQVREIAEVATAIARGDLSRKITVDVQGEILELKNTINTLVDQLNGFAAEVTRVAREVGTEGKLGGQATVPGVAGTWKDLTDNVNVMADNLTNQVRGIVKVVTAVANGDLTQKLTVESKGEIAALANTINGMIDTLAIFADQVTTVAREVGVEGRLGGQANVPGAAGTWKDLTANVNLLAANLTTQVRAIAEVATAVTKGDLTRYIQVEAKGEVADLKNYINAMIGNLRRTTERNKEQDWLKTNLAKFSRMMQGQRDLSTVANMLLSELAPLVRAQQGIIYVLVDTPDGARLRQLASYADGMGPNVAREYAFNEGLVGQCARERKPMILRHVPGRAIRITSGLIDAEPHNVVVMPVLFEGEVKAVIELASLDEFSASHISFLEQLADIVGVVLNNIEVTMRTERLLAQSQQLATEQQTQQRELQKTNEELARKARLLAAQNAEVERKNREIEQARRALEEKAAELALTSRYKSEFLANMSHELRTPLNSILVLSQQLVENADSNLSERQIEYAATIRAAGKDLLNLISDILDLSKIESGTVTVECEELPLANLKSTLERAFAHEAESSGLQFSAELDPSLDGSIHTDPKRLLQVMKNLLSNAFKFTVEGSVKLRVRPASDGWTPGHPILDAADAVIAFEVIDTGIGIPPDKQKIVFEAFQQADAGTARKHGGTGLGLAISRELAQLLGGELKLASVPGSGSTFTLYLPSAYAGPAAPAETSPSAVAVGRGPMLAAPHGANAMHDDRETIVPGDRVLLAVQSDGRLAQSMVDAAHEAGLKAVVTGRGGDVVSLARQFAPLLISIDASLPDMHGWTVLSRLKHDPELRHVPVQWIGRGEDRVTARRRGAKASLARPIEPADLRESVRSLVDGALSPRRRLLVVEGSATSAGRLAELAGGADVETSVTALGNDALALLARSEFDCVLLDAVPRDLSAADLLRRVTKERALHAVPFVVYDPDELLTIGPEMRDLIVRRATTLDKVLDETALFLHRDVRELPQDRRALLESPGYDVLAGKTVLVVDDDVRNIFALTTLLERHQMRVVAASSGAEALELLDGIESLSLVLLDIMMPEMDGYETIRRMRQNPRFDQPIVALTAKAMAGDREKCLEAGASDYIAKPVDGEQFLSLLRVWLDR
ncbi:MAG TPA: HAMP domain-containing protein, partial [Gammaproteobacteria bacterium]